MSIKHEDDNILSAKMEALAEGHARGDELRAAAKAFREANKGLFGKPQTVTEQKFIGIWVRARRLWCEITGEPLV